MEREKGQRAWRGDEVGAAAGASSVSGEGPHSAPWSLQGPKKPGPAHISPPHLALLCSGLAVCHIFRICRAPCSHMATLPQSLSLQGSDLPTDPVGLREATHGVLRIVQAGRLTTTVVHHAHYPQLTRCFFSSTEKESDLAGVAQ